MSKYTQTIATRGDSILLKVIPGTDTSSIDAEAVIVQPDGNESKPLRIQQALKWGYWSPVNALRVRVVP